MLDWTTCPHCHEDLEIEAVEEVVTYTPVNFELEGGELAAASYDIVDHYDWENSQYATYHCNACKERLPREYEYELRDLLYR